MKLQLLNTGGRDCSGSPAQTAQAKVELAHSLAACSTTALFWSGREGLAGQMLMEERREGIKRREEKRKDVL